MAPLPWHVSQTPGARSVNGSVTPRTASAKLRLDIVIRNAIAAGQIPGPRLKACGPEITVTGGLGDERSAHMYRESFAVIADGPAEIVK